MELIYEKLDIKLLRTTAYHSECDGKSERFIRTLKGMITGYVSENQKDWDEHLEKFKLKDIYSKAIENGDLIMNKTKIRLDRNIRKFD